MRHRCGYGFGRIVGVDCDEALRKLKRSLQRRGFEVLFEREMGEVWRDGDDRARRYVILGAYNPSLGSRAHAAEPDIGLIIPFHLVVYEDEKENTRVMSSDPAVFMDLLKRPAAIEMAIAMKEELELLIEEMR